MVNINFEHKTIVWNCSVEESVVNKNMSIYKYGLKDTYRVRLN